jgi:hypothetical protein
MRRQDSFGLLGVVIVIVIAAASVFVSFGGKPAGIRVSCLNATILEMRPPIGPPFMVMGETCNGHIIVNSFNSTLICDQKGSSLSITTPESVIVPCPGLENYLNQTVNVYAEVSSSYGNFNSSTSIIVNWGSV